VALNSTPILKRFAVRSKLPNCVPFQAGEFGMPSDCVTQREAIYTLEKGAIDVASGTRRCTAFSYVACVRTRFSLEQAFAPMTSSGQ